MNTRALAKINVIALGLFCVAGVAHAWLRRTYSDADVVSRAELVVVGRVKPGSVVLVPHEEKFGGVSWEHHVELLISEVLKGQTTATSMVVSIHYGLDPVTGGYVSNRFMMLNLRSVRTNYPSDIIEVFDTGNSAVSFTPITGDIRTNHIWLLHHAPRPVRPSDFSNSDMIGIIDPEDIQPISKRDELMKLLRSEPGSEPSRAENITISNCPTCGARLFFAIPHVTTKEDIRDFALHSKLPDRDNIASNGWIHPGAYCSNGCYEVLYEFRRQ